VGVVDIFVCTGSTPNLRGKNGRIAVNTEGGNFWMGKKGGEERQKRRRVLGKGKSHEGTA